MMLLFFCFLASPYQYVGKNIHMVRLFNMYLHLNIFRKYFWLYQVANTHNVHVLK